MKPLDLTRPALTIAALGALAGCSSARTASPEATRLEGRMITANDIARSGAMDAWEAIRLGGVALTFAESASGNPRNLSSRRRASVVLSSVPLVVVDGVQMLDFGVLKNIAAPTIVSIRILNGVEGTRAFGTGAGNGVIIVNTQTLVGEQP